MDAVLGRVIGKISSDDLEALRKFEAASSFWQEVNIADPSQYDYLLEQHVERKRVEFAFYGRLIDVYNIPEELDWWVNPATGTIIIKEG